MCKHDDKYELHDVLMILLVTSTPQSVLHAIAQTLREDVSIKAADAAERVFFNTQRHAEFREKVLCEYRTTALPEELRGDCAPPTPHDLAD